MPRTQWAAEITAFGLTREPPHCNLKQINIEALLQQFKRLISETYEVGPNLKFCKGNSKY